MVNIMKDRSSKGILAVMLMAAFLVTGLFSVNASAVFFYQGGDVISTGLYTGGAFSSGSDNRLTVSASAQKKAGNPTKVNLQLQKNGFFGWSTVKTGMVITDGKTQNIWRDLVIDKNTSYRILCTCEGSGADAVTISLGIGTWQA